MNTRIKELRKALKLSQDEFAEQLNLSRNFVWMMEKGEREPSERTIKDICRVYEINEDWLRTGAGEMLAPKTREKEIADIAKQMLYADESDFKTSLIEMIAGMPPEMIEYLKNWTLDYAEKIKEKELP